MTNSTRVDVPDNHMPRDNVDLVKTYGAYVARLVMRHNRVTSNFDDLLQHTWMKLIEVDVIGKHKSSMGHLPKHLSGAQASSFLRMPWFSFLKRVHRGVRKEQLYARAYARDCGVCTKCRTDTTKYVAALEKLRVGDPDQFETTFHKVIAALGVDSLPSRFWVVDGDDSDSKTICLFCAKRLQVKAVTFRWYPVPIRGSWSSRDALYDREDIQRLQLVLETEKDRPIDPSADPSSVLSKSLFKQYLARAVHNIYANWCRTRDRRYKEQYKGNDESTGKSWEETLGDPFGPRQESMAELSMTVRYLAGGGNPLESTAENESEVMELFDSGKTFQEVGRRMSIRPKVLQAYTG